MAGMFDAHPDATRAYREKHDLGLVETKLALRGRKLREELGHQRATGQDYSAILRQIIDDHYPADLG